MVNLLIHNNQLCLHSPVASSSLLSPRDGAYDCRKRDLSVSSPVEGKISSTEPIGVGGEALVEIFLTSDVSLLSFSKTGAAIRSNDSPAGLLDEYLQFQFVTFGLLSWYFSSHASVEDFLFQDNLFGDSAQIPSTKTGG
jgi:hypothetical protein